MYFFDLDGTLLDSNGIWLDIDSQVADLAKIVGYGISLALQPGMTVEDLELLLS